MTPGVPAKVIASAMGLGAFAIAVIAGLSVDNPADQILTRAVASTFVCHLIGYVIGTVAERVVSESVQTYIDTNPMDAKTGGVPRSGSSSSESSARTAAA